MELSATHQLPASYVYPSVGGFDEHVSAFMNTKKVTVRECPWEVTRHSLQEGTRERDQNGRAFSRSLPWHPYQLKEFPLEQKHRHQMEVTLINEIPTLPLDQPDIWWTGAATVSPRFYESGDKKDGGGQAPPGGGGTARSFQPSKRVGSPTRQLPWKWQRTKVATRAPQGGMDEKAAAEIMISEEQTWHPNELSAMQTQSSHRRVRTLLSNFERRFFTNDPDKVVMHSRKLLTSKNELSAISFFVYMIRFSIASHIPQIWIRFITDFCFD